MALAVLWWRRPHSVLDLWLLVVMVVWLFDVALGAVFSAGRFDLGFYAGRIYGLLAASFVLMALLIETGALYARLADVYETDRRRAADEISSINARLDTLLDSSPLPVFSLDADGRVATWNSAAERIFGRSAAEMIGQDFAALPENAGNDFAAVHARVFAGERLQDLQMHWRHRDGRPLDVVHSGAPVREAGERVTAAVYVSEDVTDKRKLERQLAQAQKMEAVGQLTGGIAHDFNNILTVITGTIEILADGVADRPALADIANLIDEAAMRGADLTRQLLAFARKQPLQPQKTDINALVAEAAKLLRPTLGEQVEIESVLEADAWPALIDRGQLVTAIINLAINARDAMPDGGKLTLETGNVVLDEAYASLNPDVRPGPYVMVAVSDTGTGIPAALLDKVLEPFFTTKEVGKGTGLGLSMVYGFVKQSGGHIKIYSEEGHGTSIKLYLPRAAGLVQPSLAETATARRAWQQRARMHPRRRGRPHGARARGGAAQQPGLPHARGRGRGGRAGAARWRRRAGPPVHRRDHAGRHRRAPAGGPGAAAPARPQDPVHLRLHRDRDRAPRSPRSRRAAARQALPQDRSGADGAQGAGGGAARGRLGRLGRLRRNYIFAARYSSRMRFPPERNAHLSSRAPAG